MVDPYLRKACLLTALACLVALPAAAAGPSDNPDDGQEPSDGDEPCDIVLVGTQPPYVDPHPECIPL